MRDYFFALNDLISQAVLHIIDLKSSKAGS